MPTRDELTRRVESATQQIVSLQRQLAGMIEASRGDNADDEHDPEGSTIAFERQQLASLLERLEHSRGDALHALAELEAGRYGICERCGGQIAPERLEARPEARLCIDCARAR
ncbi:MAG TPA: TraR/DksA C4-type zinc finger protein [Actinomycetales bacterium]|nr:TraR/DksA C4-type zinc finger protein [Actinomycetales bacterium]